MRQQLLLVHLCLALTVGCTDPREDNRFDPDNSFVRFNYENSVTDPARDAVTLDRSDTDTLLRLPIALSAPLQARVVRIDFAVTSAPALVSGTDFRILTEDGQQLTENTVRLEPGDLDYVLGIQLTEPLAEPATLTLELTGSDPIFLLGFPGTGRGRNFIINYE